MVDRSFEHGHQKNKEDTRTAKKRDCPWQLIKQKEVNMLYTAQYLAL